VIGNLTWEEAEVVELGLQTLPYYKFCLYKLFTDVGLVVVQALPVTYFFRLVNAIDLCYVVVPNFLKLKTLTKGPHILM